MRAGSLHWHGMRSPVFEIQVAIPRGLTAELRYELTEPPSPGAPRVAIQPLRDNVAPMVFGARMLGMTNKRMVEPY